ncbi:hypothetical protein M011DRAFT_220568 [Sporormia fimetaria CBS 119925]|uniref:Uncharacterized protein n=1 Tax=Sporormia fimetaria CBS 119925 TaxID=1340428 RepID=A0A6A6V258_9PLEO|nr:hypothetical protein M011DRAFT_220568 [Sporormia fimetaria CBS 119925]
MPSPFHQKYSSQTHKVFTTPSLPGANIQQTERRESDASTSSMSSSPPSSPERRRSSAAKKFEKLDALKRPTDPDMAERRASYYADAYARPGFVGTMWTNFTRGKRNSTSEGSKSPRDTSTLSR